MNRQSDEKEMVGMLIKVIAVAVFIGSIFGANYMISNVGTFCVPDGPCVIPVGFGIEAPSGILAIGIAFTARDAVQRLLGVRWAIGAVVVGAGLSAGIAPALAMASGAAFLLSETLDLAVYTPLQRRNLVGAVAASNVVGLVVDSAVFLFLAFGSLAFIEGQILGKLYMTMLALPGVWVLKRRYG